MLFIKDAIADITIPQPLEKLIQEVNVKCQRKEEGQRDLRRMMWRTVWRQASVWRVGRTAEDRLMYIRQCGNVHYWIGERVIVVGISEIMSDARRIPDDIDWG